jgi:hypothetical protein
MRSLLQDNFVFTQDNRLTTMSEGDKFLSIYAIALSRVLELVVRF